MPSEQTTPRFRALDHVGYAVTDLDRSIQFYETLLGAPMLMRKTWDVPYVGEIVGYPGLVLDGAFFQLPNGVILELLDQIQDEKVRAAFRNLRSAISHPFSSGPTMYLGTQH